MEDQNFDNMSKEEIEKITAQQKKEWEDFMEDLKNNPEEKLSKGEYLKSLEVVLDNMGGIAHMTNVLMNNMNSLHHNFNQLLESLQGGGSGVMNKSKGGIILP